MHRGCICAQKLKSRISIPGVKIVPMKTANSMDFKFGMRILFSGKTVVYAVNIWDMV